MNRVSLLRAEGYKKRSRENKTITSKAKSYGAGMAFSVSHLVTVVLPHDTAFLLAHRGELIPESHSSAVSRKYLIHKN